MNTSCAHCYQYVIAFILFQCSELGKHQQKYTHISVSPYIYIFKSNLSDYSKSSPTSCVYSSCSLSIFISPTEKNLAPINIFVQS